VKPAVNRQPGLRRGNSQTSVVWQAMIVYKQLGKKKKEEETHQNMIVKYLFYVL
jgi:hypothetical protein